MPAPKRGERAARRASRRRPARPAMFEEDEESLFTVVLPAPQGRQPAEKRTENAVGSSQMGSAGLGEREGHSALPCGRSASIASAPIVSPLLGAALLSLFRRFTYLPRLRNPRRRRLPKRADRLDEGGAQDGQHCRPVLLAVPITSSLFYFPEHLSFVVSATTAPAVVTRSSAEFRRHIDLNRPPSLLRLMIPPRRRDGLRPPPRAQSAVWIRTTREGKRHRFDGNCAKTKCPNRTTQRLQRPGRRSPPRSQTPCSP